MWGGYRVTISPELYDHDMFTIDSVFLSSAIPSVSKAWMKCPESGRKRTADVLSCRPRLLEEGLDSIQDQSGEDAQAADDT